MPNKTRLINLALNAAIVMLSISAVYLLLLTMNTSVAKLLKSFTDGRENAVVSTGTENVGSITPSAPNIVLLTDEYGIHYAVKYDFETKLNVFSQLSVSLGEALGSASDPVQVTESQWRETLGSSGVFFDYLHPQPLSLLAWQLGISVPESAAEITARRLCLTKNSEGIFLYYIDETTGGFFRLNTALDSALFSQPPSELGLLTAEYAFETESRISQTDPYFIFSGETISLNTVNAISPLPPTGAGRVFLTDFSMNESTSRRYSDSDFTEVYVEGAKSLRISSSGMVLFTVTGTSSEGIPVRFSGETPTLSECILSAASLISSTIAPLSGEAEIGLSSIEPDSSDEGGYTLSFIYYVNGIPVYTADGGWCAKIQISGKAIVRAELIYQQYTSQNKLALVLPEEQAVILAETQKGSPQLFYANTTGTLSPEWHNGSVK